MEPESKATHAVKELLPLPGLLEMNKEEWYQLSEEKFNSLFARFPV